MALGVVGGATGTVLAATVRATTGGLDVHDIGIAVAVAGLLTVALSVLLLAASSYRRTTLREQVRVGAREEIRVLRRNDASP